ncbi:hypothetical protein J6590_038093 [Homalodisca vitripennis]|nr:hypothetical protein J6590_038093 [Homalodisca vitripennis]
MQKCEGILSPEYRKFSVDPQITSFEVLQSILAKAFDIKGDFTVRYKVCDDYGQETYLSLLSDWDLDAAFLSPLSLVDTSRGPVCLSTIQEHRLDARAVSRTVEAVVEI